MTQRSPAIDVVGQLDGLAGADLEHDRGHHGGERVDGQEHEKRDRSDEFARAGRHRAVLITGCLAACDTAPDGRIDRVAATPYHTSARQRRMQKWPSGAPTAQRAYPPRAAAALAGPWDAAVRGWLYLVAGLVFLMVVVGGATRLTDSGLSITEWKPILGAIPPLNDADWHEAFAKYREIPEYHLVNKGMSLEAFKSIYWWEWSHRFLGRFIGVAFALPFVVFLAMGQARDRVSRRGSRACWRSALCRARSAGSW